MGRRIITQNTEMLELIKFVENIAYSKSTVLIMGDTGTGKELFARHIHRMSPRTQKTLYGCQLRRSSRRSP